MKKASRGRGLRVGIVGAAAALATLCFGASQAQAVPFQAQLDNAYLKTGAFPNPGLDILDPPDQAVIQGDLTIGAPSTFVTTPAQFQFPDFSGTVLGGAVGVEVSLDALQNITGTVDGTTGAVSTAPANFKSTLILDFTPAGPPADPKDTCEINPISMAFNTTQPFPAPYAGDPFTVVLADLATDASRQRSDLDDVADSAPCDVPRRAEWQLRHGGLPDRRPRWPLDRGQHRGAGAEHGTAAAPGDAAHAAGDPSEEEVQEGSEAQEGQVRQEEEEEEEVGLRLLN